MRWSKNLKQSRPESLDELFAARVADHCPGSLVEGTTALLGGTGIRVECATGAPAQAGAGTVSVPLYVQVSGGPFGPEPSFASISGYHATARDAVVEGSCLWACTFLDLLAAAGVVAPREPQVPVVSRQARVGGRLYQVHSSHIDRAMTFGGSALTSPERVAAARSRVGGDSTMTSAVLASHTLPVHLASTALLLSTFAMTFPDQDVTTEVKVHGGDWPPSWPPLAAVGPDAPGGATLLRELAVAVPLEPARPDRDALAQTLRWLAQHRTEPHQAAGWRGWRRHGGVLQPPLTDADIAAQGVDPAALPGDYHQFLTQVGWGAGPGYGLLAPSAERTADGRFTLAHAGDGIVWLGSPDGVWADARPNSGNLTRTHGSFAAWYADWLDNAVAGARPWTHWDDTCASLDLLGRLDELIASGKPASGVRLTLMNDSGEPLEPCHVCQARFAARGLGDDVWPVPEDDLV